MSPRAIHGAGLGLRRALLGPLQDTAASGQGAIDFFEIAPENWIGVGGQHGRTLRAFTERHPFVCHGLSLSLGGRDPLDETLLAKIRRLLDAHASPRRSVQEERGRRPTAPGKQVLLPVT